MPLHRASLSLVALVAMLASASSTLARTVVYANPMMAGGGTLRTSSYWVDPTGENDSDNDSQAWTPFTLTQSATVTRVRWSGQAMPALGFVVMFYNQDPNTSAIQPHIVGDGSGPIFLESFPAPAAESLGGGLYQFTADLTTPISFDADTRYFLSVVGLTPTPYPNWAWAQGEGPGWTFWWQRGLHMYYLLAGNRAMELSGEVACPADLDGSGAVDFGDVLAVLSTWGPCPGTPGGCPGDLDADGTVGFADLLAILSGWGACP